MFGFGKKKKSQSMTITAAVIAGDSNNAIWKTKGEVFTDFDKRLIRDFEVVYKSAGHLMFFLEATAYDADFMGYGMGFVFGMGQAHSKNEEFCHEALPIFVQAYEKTISNYVDKLGLAHNPKPYGELFMGALRDNVLVESENGSDGLASGLADGKGFGDYQIAIQADYSKMNDVQMATKANLNGLRELLKQWQIGCLLNSDLLQAMKEAHKS